MYSTKKYCLIIFGFILFAANISAEIEIDYFFGEASLRSPKVLKCETEELIQQCARVCGSYNYGCLFGNCICHGKKFEAKPKNMRENASQSPDDIRMMIADLEDLIQVASKFISDTSQLEEEEMRPALRHHIAHFCPNLAVARKCIRTCMKVGKPAFCGKDHNCYCGHKYSEHDTHPKVDATDIYAQFRDLYTKYFGSEGGTPNNLKENE